MPCGRMSAKNSTPLPWAIMSPPMTPTFDALEEQHPQGGQTQRQEAPAAVGQCPFRHWALALGSSVIRAWLMNEEAGNAVAEVVTGEAVVLEVPCARFPSRLLALALDLLIQVILLFALFRSRSTYLPRAARTDSSRRPDPPDHSRARRGGL